MSEKILEQCWKSTTCLGDFGEGEWNLKINNLSKFIDGLEIIRLENVSESDIYFDDEERKSSYKPKYCDYFDYITKNKYLDYCCCNTIWINLLKDDVNKFEYDAGVGGSSIIIGVNFIYTEKLGNINIINQSYNYHINLLTGEKNKYKDFSWNRYYQSNTFVDGENLTFNKLNNAFRYIHKLDLLDYIKQPQINNIIQNKIEKCIEYDKEKFSYKECLGFLIDKNVLSELISEKMIKSVID